MMEVVVKPQLCDVLAELKQKTDLTDDGYIYFGYVEEVLSKYFA